MSNLIDRQVLLAQLRDAENHAFNGYYNGLIQAHRLIADMPSAQPERTTGHWTRISLDKYVRHAYAWYRCSECGGEFLGNFNYCGNCGADMRGDE